MMESGSAATAKMHGHTGLSLARVNSFSDAVFAVAITVLVLNIRFNPEQVKDVSRDLPSILSGLQPYYIAYVISFLVIGMFWMSHHRLFDRLVRHDEVLLWLNMLYLMAIVFIPFPTFVYSEFNGSQDAAILYAASLGTASLLATVMTWYAFSGHRLVPIDVDDRVKNGALVGGMTHTLIFFGSIGISYISVSAVPYTWLLMIPLNIVVRQVFFKGVDEI